MIKQEPLENSPPEMKPSQSIEIEYSPPSKRLKTLTSDSPSTSSSSKGKSKIVKNEEDDLSDSDSSSQQQQLGNCGVCLLEEGMSLRGFIDSCQHYFCFVCIMEWAKIESRCPICKRRFSTIRRPVKDGVFPSERIVNVPVRDQIYNYRGNATIGPPDPYSQIQCSVCSGSSDDHLLLLCDLCDSAAHSYCVGLGATVPEGDWFCKDCTLSRDEHAKVETNMTSNDDDDNNNNNDNNPPTQSDTGQVTCSEEVTIQDIVRDSDGERPKRLSTVDRSNAPDARTLQRCLNVHSRIRVLRENWEGLRGGSLNFSSRVENESKTGQSQSTSLNCESTSQSRPYDVNRAWKMMDIAAKALEKKAGKKNSVSKDSEFHKKKERLLNEASKVRPNILYFGGLRKNESELLSSRKIIASAQVKNDRYNCQNLPTASNVAGSSGQSSSLATDKHCAKKAINATLEKKENVKNVTQVDGSIREIEDAKSEIQSPVKLNLKLLSRDKKGTHETQRSLMNDGYNCQNLPAASNVVGSSGQSSSLAADKRCAKKAIEASLEKKEKIKNKTQVDGNVEEIDNAKSEIQSLVKLNLKLLSGDKKLEVDAFKEVARHATHSIMAACGIEPPKARFRSFERLVCDHSQTRKRPSSTLMPTSCRECFFVFVKDVVTAIASDTTTSCKP